MQRTVTPCKDRITFILNRVPGASDKVIAMALAENENDDGTITVSQKALSKRTGISFVTVNRALSRMEDAGVIFVEPGSSQTPNTYRFARARQAFT